MPTQTNIDPYASLFTEFCKLYDDTLQGDIKKNERDLDVYWQMGKTILAMVGNPSRKAQYGKKIIIRLSHDLSQKYGDGFKTRTVRYFRDFAAHYKKEELNTAVSWSHYRALLSVADKTERRRLEKRVISEHLSKTELEKIIALSRKQQPDHTSFSLAPRAAISGIFKITDIEPDTQRLIVDLGFNVKRHLTLQGAAPIPGTYITQRSAQKFKTVIIQPGERYCFTGRLLSVIDGDTVKMRINLHFDTSIDISLRLRGIDAMELGTPEGQKAKRALSRMLKNQTDITVYTYSHDRYGRYIADLVTTNGTYINKKLVEKGHARFLKM